MPRPKGLSPESVKRIYAILVKEPKCFEDIVRETGLHRNTVGSTLKGLVERKMVTSYRSGHRIMYKMKKTKVPQIGWEIPWIGLMTTKKEQEMRYRKTENDVKKSRLTRELDKRVKRFHEKIYEKLVKPQESQDFIKVLQENRMHVTPKILIENLKIPFCLECLKKEKKLIRGEFLKETGEICCPSCGLVLRKESSENGIPRLRKIVRHHREI